MTLLEAIVLGIVQGATEFLPVSSSAHLVIVPWWLGWDAPPLVFDVAAHLGTTLALILYFWRDWFILIKAGLDILRHRAIRTSEGWLLVLLMIGTIPAALAGLLLESLFESLFKEVTLAAATLLITAALLFYCERTTQNRRTARPIESVNLTDAIMIGLAQAVAIVPGISRSGSTIAAGLLRGLSREAATRYSFLLATPIILGAGLKQAGDVLIGDETISSDMGAALIVGFISAGTIGYLAISFLLAFVRSRPLYGFSAYCTAVSLITLLAVALSG